MLFAIHVNAKRYTRLVSGVAGCTQLVLVSRIYCNSNGRVQKRNPNIEVKNCSVLYVALKCIFLFTLVLKLDLFSKPIYISALTIK